MNGESINLERDTKLIRRYLDISKPLGVSEIKFNLEPMGNNDVYNMRITYIVPEDTKILKTINVNKRFEWNNHIQKDIYNFFGLRVMITQTGVRYKKFNYGK